MDQQCHLSRAATIVIVEDDEFLLGALAFALEADGFTVHTFAAGIPVLSAKLQVDCMVVDMRLPDMDGLTLISRLAGNGLRAPTILMTTNPDERTRRRAAEMGVEIVEKPLITGELRGRIGALVAANLG